MQKQDTVIIKRPVTTNTIKITIRNFRAEQKKHYRILNSHTKVSSLH